MNSASLKYLFQYFFGFKKACNQNSGKAWASLLDCTVKSLFLVQEAKFHFFHRLNFHMPADTARDYFFRFLDIWTPMWIVISAPPWAHFCRLEYFPVTTLSMSTFCVFSYPLHGNLSYIPESINLRRSNRVYSSMFRSLQSKIVLSIFTFRQWKMSIFKVGEDSRKRSFDSSDIDRATEIMEKLRHCMPLRQMRLINRECPTTGRELRGVAMQSTYEFMKQFALSAAKI